MSVRFHEAVCFDSTKYRLDWRDDFWGDSLDARWTNTLGGGGTGAVIDAVDGGIYRLGTPTASDSSQLDWGDIRSLHILKKVAFETRVRVNGGVTDTRRKMGLWFDSDNRVEFYHDYDSAVSRFLCRDDASQTTGNTGLSHDTAFHIYRIEAFPTGEVHFYVDNVETANSPITTNIPNDAADYLQPYFYIQTNADTDPATSMDIDYAYIRQER